MNALTTIPARLPLATTLIRLAELKDEAERQRVPFNEAENGERDMTPEIEAAWSKACVDLMNGCFAICAARTDSIAAAVAKLQFVQANAAELDDEAVIEHLVPSLIADLSALIDKPAAPEAWTKAVAAFTAADEAQAAYDRDHLSPCIAAYHADNQNAERQDDLSAKEAIFDRLIDTRASAIETLMPQPAPDAAGLALKLDIFHRCELALWEHGDAWLAAIAADAKRIAGEA